MDPRGDSLETRAKQRILSPNFSVLSLVTLCYFLSLGMLIPVLTKYLDSKGFRPSEVGFIFGAIAFTAIVTRPFAGREMDRRGRKLFLAFGLGCSAFACALYPLVGGLFSILAVRLLHGLAISSFYPSATALTADISPDSRRAEALSYFSMFLYAGFAIGPGFGEFMIEQSGFRVSFLVASGLAAAALVLAVLFLRQPPRTEEPRGKGPLLHRAAAFPALILALCAIANSAASVFIPLYALAEGDGDSRYFFLAQSLAIIFVRFFVGRIADRYGRGAVIVPGTFSLGIAMLILSLGASQTTLVVGAVIFGFGWGMLFPGLLAITLDRVPEYQRGSATGTLTSAFDAAFGVSPIVLGVILEAFGFATVFVIGGVSALAATLAYLTLRKRSDAAFQSVG